MFRTLKNLAEDEYPRESVRLKEDQEYDAFLSYRGATGRFWLWVAITAHFNVRPAFFTLVVIFPCVVLLMYCAFPEPMYYFGPGWLSSSTFAAFGTSIAAYDALWLFYIPFVKMAKGTYHDGAADESLQYYINNPLTSFLPAERAWFLMVPYGSVVLALLFWFWNPCCTWFTKSPRLLKKNLENISGNYLVRCEIGI